MNNEKESKKNKRNIFMFFIITNFILFIGLYSAQALGYYEFENSRKNSLTESAMKKYEKDIKNGKKIKVSNYIEKEKNYNNLLSNMSLKLSNIMEDGFNLIMNKIFNDLNDIVNDK